MPKLEGLVGLVLALLQVALFALNIKPNFWLGIIVTIPLILILAHVSWVYLPFKPLVRGIASLIVIGICVWIFYGPAKTQWRLENSRESATSRPPTKEEVAEETEKRVKPLFEQYRKQNISTSGRPLSEDASSIRSDKKYESNNPLNKADESQTFRKLTPIQSPIDALAKLGWSIKPDRDGIIQFGVSGGTLPSIEKSEPYFRLLNTQFGLFIQGLRGDLPLKGLSRIHNLSKLTKLVVNYVAIDDLAEFRNLTSLRNVEISQVSILEPLANMKDLEQVNLSSDVPIESLEPFANMNKLRVLYISSRGIRDATPLGTLKSLRMLDIGNTSIIDLKALSKCGVLSELHVSGKQEPGFSTIHAISPLRKLIIREYEKANLDMSLLRGAESLEELHIVGLHGFDLRFLEKLQQLQRIILSGPVFNQAFLSAISNQEYIGKLTKLKELSLSQLQISDLSFLVGLNKLERLRLVAIPSQDVKSIGSLKSLRTLELSTMPIFDIQPFLNLQYLQSLDIRATQARLDVITELERRGVRVNRQN